MDFGLRLQVLITGFKFRVYMFDEFLNTNSILFEQKILGSTELVSGLLPLP